MVGGWLLRRDVFYKYVFVFFLILDVFCMKWLLVIFFCLGDSIVEIGFGFFSGKGVKVCRVKVEMVF